MPSLLDIAPPTEAKAEAEIPRGSVTVVPLPARVWSALYRKHPLLVKILQGGGQVTAENIGVNGLVDAFDAMAAVVSASAALADGAEWDSAAHFDKASTLTVEDVTTVMSRITAISYPAEYMRPLRDLLREQAAADQGGRA